MLTSVELHHRFDSRHSESFRGLIRLDPTMLKAAIFASANFLGEFLFGLLNSDHSAVMEAFFIGRDSGDLDCEHTSRITIGDRIANQPLSNPFFDNRIGVAWKLGLGRFDFSKLPRMRSPLCSMSRGATQRSMPIS